MNALFEKNGGKYEMQSDYKFPCVTLPQDTAKHISMWGERRRRFLKTKHRVRYYNLLTAGILDSHLADIDQRAEKMFEDIVKSLAEKENVTENMKAAAPLEWVQKMNNIRNRATEIVNAEVVYA